MISTVLSGCFGGAFVGYPAMTTGFSKTSDRQVYIWDSRNPETPVKQETIDQASGM